MKDFGIDTLAITTSRGGFDCALCGKDATYRRMHVFAAFFVAWIPILPLRRLGVYRECMSCRMTFDAHCPEPLAYRAVRRILASGVSEQTPEQSHDRVRVSAIYEELTGAPLQPEQLADRQAGSRLSSGRLRRRLRKEFPYLNARGICLCLYAAFMQIAEDGVFDDPEREFLHEVADSFRVPVGATVLMIQNLASGRIPTPHLRVGKMIHTHEF